MWAEPRVANNIVYFSTLTGNIESVDPCQNIAGTGKLYGRYTWSAGSATLGGSAFRTASGTQESLGLAIKTRAAVTLSETVGPTEGLTTTKREVYIQEYDSTIQKLEQPISGLLFIKSWREIFRVIK